MEDKLREYEQLKNQLKQELLEKQRCEEQLDSLQQEIYDRETEYFSIVTASGAPNMHSTASSTVAGNILKGFDGFSKSSHHQSSHGTNSLINDPLNIGLPNKDRIFSLSSAEFVSLLESNDQLPGFEEDS